MKTLQELLYNIANNTMQDAIIFEYITTLDDVKNLDIYEIAHERADSCQDLIYYRKAHELIRNSNSSDVAEAEQQMIDCGFEFKSYDETATLIAYHLLNQEISDNLRTEVQELIAVVNNYEETMSEELDEHEHESDEWEQIREQISLADELISSLENL